MTQSRGSGHDLMTGTQRGYCSRSPFRPRVWLVLALGLMNLGTCCHSAGAVQERRPNILLVMTDDQGWGDIRSHGNPQIDTPVMDRLAADGARFERFLVSPVCAPTRASLLTGRYHLRTGTHGVTRAYETMRTEEVTLAEILKAAGYATGCFGKWHNGRHWPNHPNGQGFDEFFGFCGGHINNYFNTRLEHNGRQVKTTGYITDVLTDAALEFIRAHREEPFFCYVPYNAPHAPFQVPDEYYDKYRDRGFGPADAAVYAMCENLDDNLGRLLEELDRLGLAENTIVLFLTDNGPNTRRYNGGMRGRKASVHEGGVRVPLFVRWPGRIRPGTKVQAITAHFDLLPTIVELTGVPMPKTLPLDGKSLVPLLEGRDETWPERMIFNHQISHGLEVLPDKGAVRTPRYRAVFYGGRWQLFDMIRDPGQKNNLAKEHPEVVAKLSKAYEKWFADVTAAGFDPIPATVGAPERDLTILPAHEAFFHRDGDTGISYNGPNGWTDEYLTNWTDAEAYPWWPIDVVRPDRYEVTLLYNCPASDVGARLRVEVGDQSVEGRIPRAFAPAPLKTPDRAPHGPAVDKPWAELRLGVLDLPKTAGKLIIRAKPVPGGKAPDLKAVRLQRK